MLLPLLGMGPKVKEGERGGRSGFVANRLVMPLIPCPVVRVSSWELAKGDSRPKCHGCRYPFRSNTVGREKYQDAKYGRGMPA